MTTPDQIEDHRAALAYVDDWVAHLRSERAAIEQGEGEAADDWFHEHLNGMILIANTMAEDLARDFMTAQRRGWYRSKPAALRMRGQLAQLAELQTIFYPTRRGPQLAADGLHKWVWNSALDLWSDGHHRSAVQTAAASIETHLQLKLGRHDVSGADLARQAFMLAGPKPEKPRLRLPGVPPEQTQRYASAHDGAANFGAGCFMGIRNWAAHTADEADEQVALEYLAALSVFARWVDDAEVVTDGEDS